MICQKGIIEREERYLTRKFGNEYLEYQSKVRRWIGYK
jgi:protein-S-isoprenylcysteine O-methyltransferase Ste14